MSSITLEEIAGLLEKIVVVQVDVTPTSDDDDTFREVTGRLKAADRNGLVIQSRAGSEIIPFKDILDVEEAIVRRSTRLVRRYVGAAGKHSDRQHLLDRHGLDYEFVRTFSAAEAMLFHSMIRHDILGHDHGVKPVGRPGRPNSSSTSSPEITVTPSPEPEDLLDEEESLYERVVRGGQAKKVSRIERRYIEPVNESTVRQHLLDRHGVPFDAVRLVLPADALVMHNVINHTKLGHLHIPKPPGKPGRPTSINRLTS